MLPETLARSLEIGSTESASGGLYWYGREAVRAVLGCRLRRRCFLLTLQRVDAAYQHEYTEGNDDEADDGIDEDTIVD